MASVLILSQGMLMAIAQLQRALSETDCGNTETFYSRSYLVGFRKKLNGLLE